MHPIGVMYLSWEPYGEAPLKRFLDSWKEHPAGEKNDQYIVRRSKGYDIGTYLEKAAEMGNEYVCFLNTQTQILSDNWLAKMMAHASEKSVGLVGAFGSYETMNFPDWPMFPNPHIRSNGFIIRRKLLLSFGLAAPDCKEDCYRFESGPDSMSRAINLGRELEILVVGDDGAGYPPLHWPRSSTFRLGDQDNLLLSDNRVREFSNISQEDRRFLSFCTWGSEAVCS